MPNKRSDYERAEANELDERLYSHRLHERKKGRIDCPMSLHMHQSQYVVPPNRNETKLNRNRIRVTSAN